MVKERIYFICIRFLFKSYTNNDIYSQARIKAESYKKFHVKTLLCDPTKSDLNIKCNLAFISIVYVICVRICCGNNSLCPQREHISSFDYYLYQVIVFVFEIADPIHIFLAHKLRVGD